MKILDSQALADSAGTKRVVARPPVPGCPQSAPRGGGPRDRPGPTPGRDTLSKSAATPGKQPENGLVQAAASPWTRECGPLLLLIGTTALVFLPGLAGQFVWDDLALILHNEFVRDAEHLPHLLTSSFWDVSSRSGVDRLAYQNLYRPVVSFAFWLQFQLFGREAFGFHLVSWTLHLGCVALAFAWLRSRLPTIRNSWVAAALGLVPFALHPSRPEVVSWISGSTDLWMTFFALSGVLALRQSKLWLRGLGGLFIALSFLSKEASLGLPLLLIADRWLLRRERPEVAREGIAVGSVVGGILIHLICVPPTSTGGMVDGAFGRVTATLGHFVFRTVWVFDPSVEAVPRVFNSSEQEVFALWSIVLGSAFLAALGALAWAARQQTRVRPWLADALWYALPLLPVANVMNLEGPTLVADRYLYLPLLGVSALLARALLPLVAAGPPRRTYGVGAVAALTLMYGGVSAVHARNFRTDFTLWSHELHRYPNSVEAFQTRARRARGAGDVNGAVAFYREGRRRAIADNRLEDAAIMVLQIANTVTHLSSDAEQEKLGELREFYDLFSAEPRLRLNIEEFQVDEPLPYELWQTLRESADLVRVARALAHLRTGRVAGAERQLEAIVNAWPRSASAWNILSATYARRGKWEAASAAHLRASEVFPESASIDAMANALTTARRLAADTPDDIISAAIRDARIQRQLGAPHAARQILERRLQEQPTNPRLLFERAQADIDDGRFDLARQTLQRAEQLDPVNRAAWSRALEQLRRSEAAYNDRRQLRAENAQISAAR